MINLMQATKTDAAEAPPEGRYQHNIQGSPSIDLLLCYAVCD